MRYQLQAVALDLVDCPRCGATHLGLLFRRFTNGPLDAGEIWGWWATCPCTAEPVLGRPTVALPTLPVTPLTDEIRSDCVIDGLGVAMRAWRETLGR